MRWAVLWSALGLAALMLARSFPTVLTVRTYLRRAKGQPAHPAGALLTARLFLHSFILLTTLKPTWPAKRIGQCEVVIGILYLAGLTLGYHYRL